ncbi:hypothetical protein CgunFtcFv8_011788 [Champsocephalus gunnari]|uniref:Uncharacterized protein n=1 Tax=Champsocephalus gunnari TaxID=52237 RepID=A0AAN8DAH6_CHAGU|nr:hypothetical protein CgunFtcFv8_011788 [Champsocephalus gunnari]
MDWRKSTSVQSRANLHLQQQPHPCLSSSLFPLFLPVSPLSLALSLEQTLWRRRRDVTPFTAALEPALAAPLRRFPWRPGFGVVNQRRFSADRPGAEPGRFWDGKWDPAGFLWWPASVPQVY